MTCSGNNYYGQKASNVYISRENFRMMICPPLQSQTRWFALYFVSCLVYQNIHAWGFRFLKMPQYPHVIHGKAPTRKHSLWEKHLHEVQRYWISSCIRMMGDVQLEYLFKLLHGMVCPSMYETQMESCSQSYTLVKKSCKTFFWSSRLGWSKNEVTVAEKNVVRAKEKGATRLHL